VWGNRGKQSLVLDTKDGPDRSRLEDLLAVADVYLHNLAPDAAARASLDPESVRQRHPHLVACAISGFGSGGPRSSDKAYDLAVQAEAGVFDVTGDGDVRAKVGFSAADIAAGMYAFSGILAGLVQRERTGRGATVNVAMLDALAEWMSAPLLNAHAVGRSPKRTARRHATIAPYGTFTLDDGSVILLAIQNEREWTRLCELVLRQPELVADDRFVSNERRIAHVDALEEVLCSAFAAAPASEMRERIRVAELACARVNTLADVWSHEQLRSRRRFLPTSLPDGAMTETLRLPIVFDDALGPDEASVPALGDHDADLLARQLAQRSEVRRSEAERAEGQHSEDQ
jgi:itaconate CoA-transferase